MADDIHGVDEWGEFDKRIHFAYHDRPVVEIEDKDPIFHVVYDLDDRYHVVGRDHLREGSKNGGTVGYWRGIYDQKGRLVVAACYNSDIGDSWEWADDPNYPERLSALGIRIGVNYILYAMTH